MSTFLNRTREFIHSEDGPTATEYAVMLALIIIVSLGAITGLGTTVQGIFTTTDTTLTAATGGAPAP
ncbi:MAG: Flp family type IVb pilin [Planctomycetota bacterium]|jgi:pilus assembly protein Flp/PilA